MTSTFQSVNVEFTTGGAVTDDGTAVTVQSAPGETLTLQSADAVGTALNSGNVTLTSGANALGGTAGDLTLATGGATSFGVPGNISIATGIIPVNQRGDLDFSAGTTTMIGGPITISTTATTGAGNPFNVVTALGNATGANGGAINLTTGNGGGVTGGGGDITLQTGDAAIGGVGGNIIFIPGATITPNNAGEFILGSASQKMNIVSRGLVPTSSTGTINANSTDVCGTITGIPAAGSTTVTFDQASGASLHNVLLTKIGAPTTPGSYPYTSAVGGASFVINNPDTATADVAYFVIRNR